MAKSIYSLKLYLFRGPIKLTKREEKGLLDLGHFLVQIYVKVWFTAPNSISASANDLTLLKRMDKYSDVNVDISKETVKKLLGQLWYLSVELIPLCLFDRNVLIEIKIKITNSKRTRR